jgi:uncharacterized repeat protein (TIGR03806 family)
MMLFSKQLFKLMLFSVLLYSCSKDEPYVDVELISPVNYELAAMPYANLSDYNFFEGDLKNLNPVYGVVPYELINPLFSDFSTKKRFVWIPNNLSAVYIDDSSIFDFPIGSILIKNFFYENVLPEMQNKIIETRLMIKKDEGWIFAGYTWNNSQLEAVFNLDGSNVNLQWSDNGVVSEVNYRVPSASECFTCHKRSDKAVPIGVRPRNLNKDLNYGDATMNQLQKWKDIGYLNEVPSSIQTVLDWKNEENSLEQRVRGYMDINCAHCHSDNAHCSYRPLRLDYQSTEDLFNMGVCMTPDTELGNGTDFIVTPGNHSRSVLHYRMATVDEEHRMPLLGRTVVHQEAVDLVQEWINSLTLTCD